MTPIATVVIPAYRAADTIAACLRGLQEQDIGEAFEVIVVASGGDATAHIVRRGFPRVLVLESPGRLSPGAGRNAGLARARAPVIAFLAADCVPERDWLRRRVDAHRAGEAVVGGFVDTSRPSTLAGWAQYFAKFWGMLRFDGARHRGRGPLLHLSYRRELLDHLGPFSEIDIAGEDTVFNHALVSAGYRVWFDSAIRVRHLNSRRWRDVLAAQREQGAATGALCRDHEIVAYYAPSARGGPFMPARMVGRAFVTVLRHRRDVLVPFLSCAPLTLIAISVRRRSFRRALRGQVVPSPVESSRTVRAVTPCPERAPEVSVVVAAYNEEDVIGGCLDRLLAQTRAGVEIIVVDDGSTDRTVEVATTRAVPVICLEHRGPAHARNVGTGVARGRAVVFVDADLRLDDECVERLAHPILTGAETATFTREIGVANPDNRWAACWSLHRGVPPGAYMPHGLPQRWANLRAVARDAFLDVDGYDDVGYGEDMTLAPKLGVLARAVDGARMWHHNPDSLREVWENARWVGKGARIREHPRAWRRHLPWHSITHGIAVAHRARLPRYALFQPVYDLGVLCGYASGAVTPRRHWK